jgi:uncharacterized membrane protein
MGTAEPKVAVGRPLSGSLTRYLAGIQFVGALGAGLFFAMSLAPSLIPRSAVIQGLVSGVSAAAGYWICLGILWIWRFLELPEVGGRAARAARTALTLVLAMLVVYSLWYAAVWQDSARAFLGLEPMQTSYAAIVVLIAVPLALLLRALGRVFAWVVRAISRLLDRFLPRRVSIALGLVLAAVLLVNVTRGTVGAWGLQAMDAMFLEVDQLVDEDLPRPSDPAATGSPASLVSWGQLGRQGRHFVATGPTKGAIEAFGHGEAKRPIRVYVGLGAAATPEARAALAVAEMKRVGAFDRSVLVIATPTGTGWVDEAAVDTLEYLHGGDTAIVAQQYSYLTSYVSIFVEPGFATETAAALFDAVSGHWKTLPRDARPRLYLFGLSLGAYGSEQSMDLYRVLGDLIQGAVWSGPPYRSPNWQSFTRNRDPESPVWRPRFGDGSLVRFTNQESALEIPGATWGPVRLVYLQYASDPITFFSPDLFFREPQWLSGERGPDVSPELSWFPVVTALQVVFDMAGASALGPGLGHLYAAEDYIDAWMAVTDPRGWAPPEVARLKARFAE